MGEHKFNVGDKVVVSNLNDWRYGLTGVVNFRLS